MKLSIEELIVPIALGYGALIVAGSIIGFFARLGQKGAENRFNWELRNKLEKEKEEFERGLKARMEFVETLRNEFEKGYLGGRKWLAHFIADADKKVDESIASELRYKRNPARKASEEVKVARAERRAFKERLKFLEYQLRSYEEYFPILEEYRDAILDEAIKLVPGEDNADSIDNADPVLRYLQKAEYDKISPEQRNQLALDRYLSSRLSPAGIGRMYERYVGYLYEKAEWDVEYHGIFEGLEDLGRDLICTKDDKVQVVQAKCWANHRVIREKHLFQLFGTSQLFKMNASLRNLDASNVTSVFITTTSLSDVALEAAKWLSISVKERFALAKNYPMIKCNVNQSSGEKIYHLPFDQQYDRTKIIPALGEKYTATVAEAESAGFRRAFRFTGMS